MAANTGEGENTKYDYKLHKLSAFEVAYPETAGIIRSLQHQIGGEGENKPQTGLEKRLDILERMILRQQAELNSHANTIMQLRMELARLDRRNRDGK